MVYCAAFVCSFYTFPKDTNVRKQWVHYCRRKDFIPGKGHRLCSVHFSNECFEKRPELIKQMGLKFNKQLKTGAVPNIPLLMDDDEPICKKKKKKRGIYAKTPESRALLFLSILRDFIHKT
jgi:hypothetical protein